MTLDEAIKHAEEVAEQNEEDAEVWVREGWQSSFKNLTPEKEAEFYAERVKLSNGCAKCAEEHRQLAEWLKELKTFREQKRSHENWEYLKELITDVRDADGRASQKGTCQYILNLMEVIERGR